MLLLAMAGTAAAATFTVDSPLDVLDGAPGDGACVTAAGTCSLRAAIQEAEALPGPDRIDVPVGAFVLSLGTIGEDAGRVGDLDIHSEVEVVGTATSATMIDGGRIDRVFHVHAGGRLTLRTLTITGGRIDPQADGMGAGIFVEIGTAVVDRCAIRANAGGWGGGIMVLGGSLYLDRSSVAFNTARNGGGISANGDLASGTIDISGSTVEWNTAQFRAGGLYPVGLTWSIRRTRIARNEAQNGGGLYVASTVDVSIEDTTIADNAASNEGGGLSIATFRPVRFDRCLVVRNSAENGGGIYLLTDGAQTTLLNSTISGNTAGGGGAVGSQNDVAIELRNCTVTDNEAGWTGGVAAAAVTVGNSIVAGNRGGTDLCTNAGTSLGWNIVGSTCAPFAWGRPSDIAGAPPLLASLADNGGPTLSHVPTPGSPAIDGGDPAGCRDATGAVLLVDQRGLSRPEDGNADGVASCDIGGVEACGDASDGDGDGVGDRCDCALADSTAHHVPESLGLRMRKVSGPPSVELSWQDVIGQAGSSTAYDIASDAIASLWLRRSADAPCVVRGWAGSSWSDLDITGAAYYLVRGVNSCNSATPDGWGTDSFGTGRPACP